MENENRKRPSDGANQPTGQEIPIRFLFSKVEQRAKIIQVAAMFGIRKGTQSYRATEPNRDFRDHLPSGRRDLDARPVRATQVYIDVAIDGGNSREHLPTRTFIGCARFDRIES